MYGVNDAPRVKCSRFPKTHSMHPKGEACPDCDPVEASLVLDLNKVDTSDDEVAYHLGWYLGMP